MGRTDIWAPVIYVSLLIGALSIFSYFYRKRAAGRRKFEPWFSEHPDRDLYTSLVQQSAPDTLLKAALLRRAVADVTRILRIREDKAALQVLIQKGSVGDDLWNSCLTAEKELEVEILEVMSEANTFRPGWGQFIFQSAGEIMHHDKIREALESMPSIRSEAEAKYGVHKAKSANASISSPITPSPSDHTPSVTPQTASTLAQKTVMPSTSNGSAHLSDGESATGSPSAPNARKSAKKAKKRK